jgi:lipopolysaccharide export system permease protein
VKLLSRYLLRQLAAPFLFGLTALTSLMLLSQIAKKFGSLVGKGLPWTVIAEVFALSIPFIVAMTLPMAVLVAVLYAFSHLAADNEITAMRASGISVYQVLLPVLFWGVFMAAFNFIFVDQVLPRSNARLRTLLIDIGRKKPTFELREQVINEVPPSSYFLRANRIDANTGRLREVTIYDVGSDASRRVIYADSGLMAYAEGQTDLSLRLFDGSIHSYRPAEPLAFQLTYFKVNDIRVKNVFDELERNTNEAVRGDREMSTCEMLDVIRESRRERREAIRDRSELLRNDLRSLLALPQLPSPEAAEPAQGLPPYCRWMESVQELVLPKTASAQTPTQGPQQGQGQDTTARKPAPSAQGKPVPKGRPATQARPGLPSPQAPGAKLILPGQTGRRPVPPPAAAPGRVSAQAPRPPSMADRPALSNWSLTATAVDRAQDSDRRAARFAVEVHKKYSISFACISFVIVGIVMAVRFPRGGIGLVIGGALLMFSVHYVGLTAGESLADRGRMSPWLAMWMPNIVLTTLGIIGLIFVSRESGSTRGGDWQEVLEGIKHLWRRVLRRA